MAVPSPAGTLLALMNRTRARAHLPQLHTDRRLARAARLCSEDVLAACARHLGVRARLLGENTARYITEGPGEALEVLMESPPHRANILYPGWRAAGVAVLGGTTYVQVFGP
jgi:uncharacterized protein YkwD